MKINKAIRELPPLFKTIILLREIDGLSYEEIAELTNLNIGTVKSRIARARIKLKNDIVEKTIIGKTLNAQKFLN